MSSYKNNRICYIPEQVIVRHLETVLNADPEANRPLRRLSQRTHRLGTALLGHYASALKPIRASGITQHKKFSNGM